MFSFISKLIFIKATVLSLDSEHEKDLVLKRFITAFDDKALLENWIENRNIKCSTAIELLKNITKKVRDILSVINNEEFSVIKLMIMETNMVLSRIGYPYFETINIINSLQRILTINDKMNMSKSKMQNNLEEIIFKEYVTRTSPCLSLYSLFMAPFVYTIREFNHLLYHQLISN